MDPGRLSAATRHLQRKGDPLCIKPLLLEIHERGEPRMLMCPTVLVFCYFMTPAYDTYLYGLGCHPQIMSATLKLLNSIWHEAIRPSSLLLNEFVPDLPLLSHSFHYTAPPTHAWSSRRSTPLSLSRPLTAPPLSRSISPSTPTLSLASSPSQRPPLSLSPSLAPPLTAPPLSLVLSPPPLPLSPCHTAPPPRTCVYRYTTTRGPVAAAGTPPGCSGTN